MVVWTVPNFHVGVSPNRTCLGTFTTFGADYVSDFVAHFENETDRGEWYQTVVGFHASLVSLNQQLTSNPNADSDDSSRAAVQALGVQLKAYHEHWMSRYALEESMDTNYVPLSIVMKFSQLEDLVGITNNFAFRTDDGMYH